LNIFFTFDYELFLGINPGTIDNCLTLPMNMIISLLNNYNIKSTVFVDAAYLLRLTELSESHEVLQNDLKKIKEHIGMLHKNNHTVQMHFHPQWLYSTWESGQWIMDKEHYKLSDMDTKFALNKLNESCNLLESIIDEKIIAFRAGGYSLTTFNSYIDFFDSCGIRIDSSVLRNSVYRSMYQSYCYNNIPIKTIYNFSSDICIEDSSGIYKELSITTKAYNPVFYLIKRGCNSVQKTSKAYGDGIGIGIPDGL
jgi:hypothetical protein